MQLGVWSCFALPLVWLSAPDTAALACVPKGDQLTIEQPRPDGPLTLRGRDGTRYRLAGIVPTAAIEDADLEKRLGDNLAGHDRLEVTLVGEADRYHRLPIVWTVDSTALPLTLVKAGLAVPDPAGRRQPCRAELLAAETAALVAGHHTVIAAGDTAALNAATGRQAYVRGRVLNVRTVRKITYINFGRRGSGALTAIIREKNRAALQRDGIEPDRLKGQEIFLAGKVIQWRGPQIDIERAENLRIPAMKPSQ